MKCYSAKYLGDPVGRRPVTTQYWARNATSTSFDPETTYTFGANQNFAGLGFEIADLGKTRFAGFRQVRHRAQVAIVVYKRRFYTKLSA